MGYQARADRYTYLPLIGLSIAVAWGAVGLSRRWARGPRVLAVVAVVTVAALAAGAYVQVGTWRNSFTLFERALSVTEANWLIHDRLGDAYSREGRTDEAIAQYRLARGARPGWAEPHFELAELWAQRGGREAAIESYRTGLERAPGNTDARVDLGVALLQVGRNAEAKSEFERALAPRGETAAVEHNGAAVHLDSTRVTALKSLAWILATSADVSLRDPEGSIRLAEAALESAPADRFGLYDTLAAAYASAARFPEAVRAARRALELARAAGPAAAPHAEAIRKRLELFRAERPYVESGA